MADIFSVEKRSSVMGLVKGKNTKPEVVLRKKLHLSGFRFRLHDRKLPGKPDIKLTKYKTVIFVNGCFWHAHQNCKHYTVPKTNNEFWVAKIIQNKNRDSENYGKLADKGWNVIVVWTCNLKQKKIEATVSDVIAQILISKI